MQPTGNWIIDILNYSFGFWSDAMRQIHELLLTSPEALRGGSVYRIMSGIHGGLKAVSYALLVLFFLAGVVRATTSFSEIKRPEAALKLFIRFAVAKAIVTYSMDLLSGIFRIVQGILRKVSDHAGSFLTEGVRLPEVIERKILECGFLDSIPLWIVSMIGALLITVLSFVMILTVYSRFFKLYMYTAVAPVPLSSFAGEGTGQIGKQFLKSYAGVCLQGVMILIACVIYSAFAETPTVPGDTNATTMVFVFVFQMVFNFLLLVGSVRMSERVVKEMIGF